MKEGLVDFWGFGLLRYVFQRGFGLFRGDPGLLQLRVRRGSGSCHACTQDVTFFPGGKMGHRFWLLIRIPGKVTF